MLELSLQKIASQVWDSEEKWLLMQKDRHTWKQDEKQEKKHANNCMYIVTELKMPGLQ